MTGRPSAVPRLSLPTDAGPTGWLHEAMVIYDGSDADVKRRVQLINVQLGKNGVRTCIDLNNPGSV